MYQTLFAISYYGLMRVGEVTLSEHVLKARNIHAALNKGKILIVLYSSKTHSKGMRPQKIKITSNNTEKANFYSNRNFCLFYLIRKYMQPRGDFDSDQEQFFVFRDKSPVTPDHARSLLKKILNTLGLDPTVYERTSDLIKCHYYNLAVACNVSLWLICVVYTKAWV